MQRFYIGTHEPSWIARTIKPLFLSRRRLARLKSVEHLGKAGPWALDSGGFTELNLFGRWETPAQQYADEVCRWSDMLGRPDFAVCQDWMCEEMVRAKTGLSVAEHQSRTIASFWQLSQLAPGITWAPVLQGWRVDDYLAHREAWHASGVRLDTLPTVGVGSVCRRQATREATDIFVALYAQGLRNLHGFGLKLGAMKLGNHYLRSADSMAWSFAARKRRESLPGCTHKTCGNCFHYAMRWHDEVLRVGHRPDQLFLIA